MTLATAFEPVSIFVASGTGVLALAFVLVSERRGRPIPPRNPNPFAVKDAAACLLVAFGVWGLQLVLTLPLAVVLKAGGEFASSCAAFAASVGVVFLTLVIAFILNRFAWRRLANPRGSLFSHLWMGLLILMAALPLIYGAAEIMRLVFGAGEQQLVMILRERRPGWTLIVLYALGVAPLLEEFCFRGFLYAGIRERFGPRWAMAISAVLFGAVHFEPGSILPLAVFGVALAHLVERTGSLRPCVIAHFCFNLLTIIAGGIGE